MNAAPSSTCDIRRPEIDAIPQGEVRPLPDTTESEGERAARRVADAVHRAIEAILGAVDAVVSVELVRLSRYHDGRGDWGDQMVFTVREAGKGG